jgi:hypothetical protein
VKSEAAGTWQIVVSPSHHHAVSYGDPEIGMRETAMTISLNPLSSTRKSARAVAVSPDLGGRFMTQPSPPPPRPRHNRAFEPLPAAREFREGRSGPRPYRRPAAWRSAGARRGASTRELESQLTTGRSSAQVRGNLIRLTFTSGGPRPSSSNAKGSNARPSQIVVCSITCTPLKSQPQMIQSLPFEAAKLPQII